MPLKSFLRALDWFKNDTRRQAKSRRREQMNSWQLAAMEDLEDRCLLANAVLTAGSLSITGTGAQNESLTVSNVGTAIRFSDANNPLSAGAGFTRINSNTVSFPVSALTGTFSVDLGNRTDVITFAPNTLVAARLGMTLM
jgi:hypothetical protein